MDSGQTLSLAVRHHQAGNLAEAERLYRQILLAEPGHVDALHMLGVIAHQVGKNDLAVDYIQQALRLHPAFPAALNNLGITLRDQGKLDDAIASYQQALRLTPDYAEAYYNLGNALKDRGKLDEAITSYQQAVRLKPNYAEAHNNLGIALKDQGKLEEAIASAQTVLRLKPDNAEAHNNLGTALRDQGKLDQAIANYLQALRLKPNYAEAHNNMGIALTDQGKFDEAISSYQQAARLRPDFAGAHNNLGNALREQGNLDHAITSYREAVRLQPNYAEAHGNLGVALSELGRIDEAIASFREAIRLNPKHAEALCQLASLLRGKLPDADRAFHEQRLAAADLTDFDRVKLLFGLAEVCDAKGEYAQTAVLLRHANALALSLRRQKGLGYNLDEHTRFVGNLISVFTPAFFERLRGFGLETERPVFIVGLPRSGTTLTEQILAAHSQVHGAGELTLARADFRALGTQPTDDSALASLPTLPGEAFRRLAQQHLDQLAIISRSATRIVDKQPENYFFLGLLAVLFPKAKFIHCRRDLRDVAVSCWMTNFRDYHWANDPASLAARFRAYQRLMAHWQAVLPVALLEVNYEETVADLPGAARRLVEWCGLDWEPACLNFNEGGRPVRTASKIQVREPVYMRSAGRWRNYEREMSELLAAIEPLVDSSG